RRSCETQLSSAVNLLTPRRRVRTRSYRNNRNRGHQMICGRRRTDTAWSEVDWLPRSLVSLRAAHVSAQPHARNEDGLFFPKLLVRHPERDRQMPVERSMPRRRCRAGFDDYRTDKLLRGGLV